jgi:hypothetical protein
MLIVYSDHIHTEVSVIQLLGYNAGEAVTETVTSVL